MVASVSPMNSQIDLRLEALTTFAAVLSILGVGLPMTNKLTRVLEALEALLASVRIALITVGFFSRRMGDSVSVAGVQYVSRFNSES